LFTDRPAPPDFAAANLRRVLANDFAA